MWYNYQYNSCKCLLLTSTLLARKVSHTFTLFRLLEGIDIVLDLRLITRANDLLAFQSPVFLQNYMISLSGSKKVKNAGSMEWALGAQFSFLSVLEFNVFNPKWRQLPFASRDSQRQTGSSCCHETFSQIKKHLWNRSCRRDSSETQS